MIKIYPSQFSGKIHAPASKTHAQRLLFMGAMPTEPTTIKNVPECDDIEASIDVLKTLGSTINGGKNEYTVHPFPKTSPMPSVTLNFKESATAARMAMGLCGAFGIKADCRASGTLPRRKMIQLSSRMAIRGVTFSGFSLPFIQEGRLIGGDYTFEGNEGSQAISALMMFLPCLQQDSTINFSSPITDKSYINITRNALNQFGIVIEDKGEGYFIPGKQYYQSPGTISAENDWGLASMWITAAAACGPKAPGLTVTDLPADSPQLYRDLSPFLALIQQDFMDINIDATKIPNLTTLFCALAIVKGATVRISGVPQLHHKEADRLKTMSNIANSMGQAALVLSDGITIMGTGKPAYKDNVVVDCQGDPWIFMSMALAAATAKKPFILSDEHGADKTYKGFLRDYKSVGGKYEIL